MTAPDMSVFAFLGFFLAGLALGLGWTLGVRIIQKLT